MDVLCGGSCVGCWLAPLARSPGLVQEGLATREAYDVVERGGSPSPPARFAGDL
jgi:hypothetical protein